MRLNSHAGHGAQDSKSCGAYTNLLKESIENRDINNDFIKHMKQDGHTIFDCTINYPASQSDCINQIIKKCNSNNVDLDISIHFNAGRNNTGGDGKIGGVECICFDNKGTSKAYAERICKELTKLGFTNRGVKYNNKTLGYLINTKAQAIIVEVCFVDDKDDVELYKKVKSQIGKAIAQGVLNKQLSGGTSVTTPAPGSPVNYTVKIITDTLNVRSGPGTDNKIVATLKKGDVYTIIEEKSGWGKLKAGTGWISLNTAYVQKVTVTTPPPVVPPKPVEDKFAVTISHYAEKRKAEYFSERITKEDRLSNVIQTNKDGNYEIRIAPLSPRDKAELLKMHLEVKYHAYSYIETIK